MIFTFCPLDQRPICHLQFETSFVRETTPLLNAMDQNLGQPVSSKSQANAKVPINGTKDEEKSNKCNQCNFASSWTGNLKAHIKRHSGANSEKCNKYNYASCYVKVSRDLEYLIFFLKKLLWGPMKVKFCHLWLRWS